MADTSQHELSEPHTNGAIDGLTEEEKSKMRPADIDADMREMERRKRVEMMMNSRLFREELERIIETQMKDGGAGPSGLLQQISDMMGAQGARFNSNVFKSSNCVVPINDIRGVESMGYAKGEKLLRCKLAAVFRLLDLYGWTQGVGGHITARLNQDQEHFLVNPYGLLYHEVTASSLVKVDMQGSIVEQGTTNFGVHLTAFQLHSTIHAARPDIKCIVHITTPSVIAVSSLKCGLLPLGQESIVIGEASVHQYIGGVFEPEEKEKISRNLGPVNKIMFLTNRGALCCGETVEEAFYNVYNTVLACETQLKLMPVGIDNLTLVSEESRKAIFDASRKSPVPQHASVAEPSPLADKLEKRWRIGGTEFEALMRMLDNAGFRTGYIYRHPLVKGEPPRPRNDVEVPPAVSSLGYLLEEEELYKQGLWKGGRKGTDRSRWLNSPNVYQKVEILETGTPDPKKITKWVDQNAEEWVTDGSPTHSSTPVRIESALQFVPKNTNPKEFKQLQQQIKDYRRADKISAGPQSHILEGVSWDEAKKMQDATISTTGEQVVLVGAASKGIIQRGFQHNAMVYKTPYAKNPFDAVTDQELDQYKKDVERKQKGDPYDESQSESEALSSFNVSRATHESSTAKSPIQSPISVTSETEEESRDEPRVLRIETKQVPVPSQPEVVLSDVHEHATICDTEPTTADNVVEDSRITQMALNQPVNQQFQNIIQQRAAVDATSEFLNEMRRTAIDPRNDSNRRDCQSSSNSSSVKSGQSYDGWTENDRYDRIHLEVARSRTIAPRMNPMITEILHPTKNNKLAPFTNVKIFKQPPPVPPKPKLNVALRNAFFNNIITSPAESREQVSEKINKLDLNSNNQTETVDVVYKIDKIQNAQVSELCIVSAIETESSICSETSDSRPKSVESEGVSVFKDILESKESNCREDDEATVLPKAGKDESHKPEIVGAILKNINDLYTLCLGSEARSEFNDNDINGSDENGNLYFRDEEIKETDIEVIEIHSTNDNSFNSIDTEDENLPKNDYRSNENRETRLSESNIEEEELSTTNKDTENKLLNKFTTPPRARNYLRLDTLTEVIDSVKIDLTPTKMLLSMLPQSNNISSKYNLDSTNMSLIYSLTPTNDDTDLDEKKISKNICADESFTTNGELKRLDSCNTDDSLHDEHTEFIWVDLLTNAKKESDTINLFDSSIESLNDDDNTSNQGSDILELPYSTVQELRETDAESFNHDMKTMANQIIAELGYIEIYTHASNFIDEILYDVTCLKLDENCGKEKVSDVVQDKLQALTIAKEIANTLIADLPCYETDDEGVIVIDEIVHHVIDKFVNSNSINSFNSSDSYNLKKVKESANSEIKEMQSSCRNDVEELKMSDKEETGDPVEVITVIDTDEDQNIERGIQNEDSETEEVDIDASQSLGMMDSSVNESFEYRGQESRYQSSDERFFITLESFSSSNHSRDIELDESDSTELEMRKDEEEKSESSMQCCQSPLDCDNCSFIRLKKWDEYKGIPLDCSSSESKLSLDDTSESNITDHDTLGEAILEFCMIAKRGGDDKTLELNLSVERDEEKQESEFLSKNSDNNEGEVEIKLAGSPQCTCCMEGTTPLEFISLHGLPPIFEENNESFDTSSRANSKKDLLEVKTENDQSDYSSDDNERPPNGQQESEVFDENSDNSLEEIEKRFAGNIQCIYLGGMAPEEFISPSKSGETDERESKTENDQSDYSSDDNERPPNGQQESEVFDENSDNSLAEIEKRFAGNIQCIHLGGMAPEEFISPSKSGETDERESKTKNDQSDYSSDDNERPPNGKQESEVFDENSDNSLEEIEKRFAGNIQCIYLGGMAPEEFISPSKSGETDERESKTENNRLDYLDVLSEDDVLIGNLFDDNGAAPLSDDNKPRRTFSDHSAVSLETVNTLDYYSCRDESNSTVFQSLQNTKEDSLKIEKDCNVDSDVEIVYISANEVDNKLDRTYTLSDTSINSLGTVSSIESDDHNKQRSGKFRDTTYSADVSTNIDETNFERPKLSECISSSSSSSGARLLNDDSYFDTTTNMADVSNDLTLNNFQKLRSSDIDKQDVNNEDKETSHDCMVYSYDTKEFMKLEKALGSNSEIDCSCLDIKCGNLSKIENSKDIEDNVLLSPIDPPPRYEDTTLYKVVSAINLNDDYEDDVVDEINETVEC